VAFRTHELSAYAAQTGVFSVYQAHPDRLFLLHSSGLSARGTETKKLQSVDLPVTNFPLCLHTLDPQPSG
jgi:hypothetical protein